MLLVPGALSISTAKVDGTGAIGYVVSYNPCSSASFLYKNSMTDLACRLFSDNGWSSSSTGTAWLPLLGLGIPSEPVAPLFAAAAILLAPVCGTTAGKFVPELVPGCKPPVPVVVLVPELDAELVVKLLTFPYCGGLLVWAAVNTFEVEGVIAGLKDDDEEPVDDVEGGWENAGKLAVCDIGTDVFVGNTGVEWATVGRGGWERGKIVLGGLKDGEGKGDFEGEVGDDMLGIDYYGFEHRGEDGVGKSGPSITGQSWRIDETVILISFDKGMLKADRKRCNGLAELRKVPEVSRVLCLGSDDWVNVTISSLIFAIPIWSWSTLITSVSQR
jgi:hypothetical protein